MRTRLPLPTFPGTSALVRAYLEDFARVQPWFDYNPFAPEAVAQRLAEVDARPWPDLSVSAALAAAQQELWGSGPVEVDNALALGHAGTCMVVTGQQPGLLGGPEYTPFKALTAVILARQLAHEHPGRRFVPVFWIASADSDFEEVSRTWLSGDDGEAHELRLPDGRGSEGQALFRREVPAARWTALFEALEQGLPAGLYRDDVLTALEAAYPADDRSLPGGIVRGFARWLARQFRGSGLVIVDPEELLVRPDIGALYAAQLRHAEEAESVLAKRNAELTAAGFHLQVQPQPNDTQLFHVDANGYRDRLLRMPDGGFAGKHSGQQWTRDELTALSKTEPQRFTGSALFRPLAENMLFPCAAWIGGQAELAYRAQATSLFALHGLRQAPAYLRHHATLLTAKAAGTLDQAGLELTAIPADAQEWSRRLATQSAPEPVAEALRGYHAAAEQADDALLTAVETELPELQRSLRTMRGKLAWHLARVERKVRAALLRRGAQRTQALLAVQRMVFPDGQLQERRLNLLSWLPRTGFELIPRLLEELDAPCWEHCLIMLD